MPKNALTGRPYSGANCISLWVMGQVRGQFSSRWASYKQWQTLGGQVRRGEKSIQIAVPMIFKDEVKDDLEEDTHTRVRFLARNVFNEDQVDIEYETSPNADPQENTITPHDLAEELIEGTGAVINIGGYRAYYQPSDDTITMPDRERFTGTDTMSATEGWYATILHELVHWSGHEKRLARDGITNARQEKTVYAFEELIAEFGAAFLCARCGIIPILRDDHRQYIAGWITALKDDSTALMRASSAADKAAEYLWGMQSSIKQEVA